MTVGQGVDRHTGADLFSPVSIGGVELRNRVVYPPMTTRLAAEDGAVTDALIAYYRTRAAGGAALITLEMSSPSVSGRHRVGELACHEDRFVPGLTRVVEALHIEGAKVSIQLGHAGSRAPSAVTGMTPVSSSDVASHVLEGKDHTVVPRPLTVAEIGEIRLEFAAAARRVERAGFDFVDLHGAHGYLASQFLSPYENRRTDHYGGSLENRARFALELVAAVRDAVSIPVIFRLGVEDFYDGGLHFEEALVVARWLAEAGVDCLSISAGHHRSKPGPERMNPPMTYEDAAYLAYARAVREIVDVPVIAVGKLGTPEVARAAVADGSTDLVALGRAQLAEPEWVHRVQAGEPIRRCLSCNGCNAGMMAGGTISCVVNGRAARELVLSETPAVEGQRIAVIGAGPAGLAYASLVGAANRVEIFELRSGPGGALRYAGKAPRFNAVEADEAALLLHADELATRCRSIGVVIHYGRAPDTATLSHFDRVVIATGARYRFGLGLFAPRMLDAGLGKARFSKRFLSGERVRHWLYYRARRGTGHDVRDIVPPGVEVTVIGDAARAGTTRDATTSAFDAALLPAAQGR